MGRSVGNWFRGAGLALVLATLIASMPAWAATKITVAVHFEAGQIEYLQPYAEEYMRLHPEIEIELLSTPFAEFLNKLQVMQASGTGPDIVHIYSLWAPQLQELRMVSPAPAYVVRDIQENYVSTAVEGVTLDGRATSEMWCKFSSWSVSRFYAA